MEHLQAFIADCDRRTDAAKKRLAETQEELTAEVAVKANAVHALCKLITVIEYPLSRYGLFHLHHWHFYHYSIWSDAAEEIGKKLAKAESLGQAGEVEESKELMVEIDELRAKKLAAEQEYRSSMPASSYQQQKLRVSSISQHVAFGE